MYKFLVVLVETLLRGDPEWCLYQTGIINVLCVVLVSADLVY